MAKYFTDTEFECKDGCGLNNIDDRLVRALDRAREKAGIPFFIESGTRCPEHNERVGGSQDSSHKKGLAADIRALNSIDRMTVIKALLDTGLNRIGLYHNKNIVHVDIDEEKQQNVMWVN